MLPMAPGRVIGGKYELVRQLGIGSMGEVWIAQHRTLNDQVALKLLSRGNDLDSLEDTASAMARFRFEAHVAARLSRGCKHIVRVTDHGEEGAIAYLVMELLEGQTLDTQVLRQGPVEPERLAGLVAQIARALDHAHAQGVVHRDLKPANVFVTRDEDGGPLVKLLDFGIARSVTPVPESSSFTTASNVVLGTPGYMSPEHVSGAAAPDRHCDLWSLATVAYEALTGELPVPGVHADELIENMQARRFVPVNQRAPGLRKELAAFFDRAFSARVDDRYQSASELARAFEHAATGLTDVEAAERAARTAVRPAKVRRGRHAIVPVGIAAAFALLSALLVTRSLLSHDRSRAPAESEVARPSEPAPVSDPRHADAVPAPESLGAPVNGPVRPARGDQATGATTAVVLAPTAPEVSMPEKPAEARPKTDCTVPYEFDAQGTKRWKRECL